MKKFTESHEWVLVEQGIGTVGVTDHAQNELGDIVYIELPRTNKSVKPGEAVVVLESTKAAADVYSPVTGTIVEVNSTLQQTPELVNKSPEDSGWLFKLRIENPEEVEKLLSLKDYLALIKG